MSEELLWNVPINVSTMIMMKIIIYCLTTNNDIFLFLIDISLDMTLHFLLFLGATNNNRDWCSSID